MGFVLAAVVTFWKAAQENGAVVQKHSRTAKTLHVLVNALHFSLPKTILCFLQSPTLLIKPVMAHAADGRYVFSKYLREMHICSTDGFISRTDPEKLKAPSQFSGK